MTDIENAILKCNLEELKNLLEHTPNLVDEVDENGVMMPFLAAKSGDINILKYIVEYSRANMNIVDSEHKNMLHYGTMSKNVAVCKYLVEKVGLSPTSADIHLQTPYELANEINATLLLEYYESVVSAPLSQMYKNPIRTGFYPDPSIVRVNDDYYMVNSSFIYFPCIPISHSKDLINWKIIGHAITNPEYAKIDELEGGRGFWAPDISYYDGKFYITATYRLNDDTTVYRKQFVMSSEKPEGPYSKPNVINEDGIDPSIFTDDDGRRYMLLNRGARIFELDKDATKQISPATMLFYGDQKRAPEGPHLLKKDDYYYLFLAEGGTGLSHRITVSRSKTLMGNYEPCPYNPIMMQNDDGAMIQRCGHGKPVMTQNGQWYMVYLCGRRLIGENGETYSVLGRETSLDPIAWTKDGWPIVNNLKGPSALQIKPNLPETSKVITPDFKFNSDNLFEKWTFVRSPEKNGYYIENDSLFLKPSLHDIDSILSRNILLTRQTNFNFEAICKMELPKDTCIKDCGIVCYYDENTYVKFSCVFINDKLHIRVEEKIDTNIITHKLHEIDKNEKSIYFKVNTQGLKREFLFSFDGENYISCAYIPNVYYLCDEGINKGKRFTGAMIGMFSYSENCPDNTYVKYENFNMK